MKVLIIDDEPGVLAVCERALRQEGHQVATCSSGEEALPRLGEHWDLIVTDVDMPGAINGNELARRARLAGDAEVALMTASPSLDSSIAAIKDGVCDYLLKPFALASLLELARRRNRRKPSDRAPIAARELRVATLLFADLRGFTAYAESAPADVVAARLDELLSRFIAAVHAEGGIINKILGDGALAVFGAPLPHMEPAAGAARAALRARDTVAAMGPLRFGFGINTGEVAAGYLGQDECAEYGVIGSAVNVAKRLEEAARPGQILLGPETAKLLDGRFLCAGPRSLELDGLGVLAVTELLGTSNSGNTP